MWRQIGEGIYFFAASQTERRTAGQEERDVGANVRGDIRELRRLDGYAPEVGQRHQGRRRIGAASAEPRLQWNLFVELHDEVANRTASPQRSPQCLGGAPDQIGAVKRY